MKLARTFLGLALLVAFVGGVHAAAEVTMEGEFVWVRKDGEKTGDLKAVFTPAGKNEWTVAFHFDWEGEPHVYTGTASGSLSSGELSGDVVSDGEREMKFKFDGAFDDGMFSGNHYFVTKEGELEDAGRMTLTAVD